MSNQTAADCVAESCLNSCWLFNCPTAVINALLLWNPKDHCHLQRSHIAPNTDPVSNATKCKILLDWSCNCDVKNYVLPWAAVERDVESFVRSFYRNIFWCGLFFFSSEKVFCCCWCEEFWLWLYRLGETASTRPSLFNSRCAVWEQSAHVRVLVCPAGWYLFMAMWRVERKARGTATYSVSSAVCCCLPKSKLDRHAVFHLCLLACIPHRSWRSVITHI